MSSHYSQTSLRRLNEAHPDLIEIFKRVDHVFPHTILETTRTFQQQEKNVASGVSKTMDSRHLDRPPTAVDAAPDPLSWPDKNSDTPVKDYARFYYFGAYVLGVADQMFINGEISHKLRWGGDWDSDRQVSDQSFDDLVHFELIDA